MDNKTLLTRILTIGIIFLFFNISVSAVLTDTKSPIINKSDKDSIDEIVAETSSGKAELRLLRSTFNHWIDILHKVDYFHFGANIINIGTDVFYGNVSYHVEIRPLTKPSKIIVKQDYSVFIFLEPWDKKTFFEEDWEINKSFYDNFGKMYRSFIFRTQINETGDDDTILWNQATEIGILVIYWGLSVFIFYI